ncbi:translesion DNA synthesis-associated protein ImuA [Parapusillimonas sp. SGNA-6]|nr:translesion DNA synthesis-associated protein ImuA [Parapusillimonas sp. SGNA-6]
MLHPERIHPALWRGSQLARARQATVGTGFPALDQELPGQGWPLGSLVELMPAQPGIGEIHLLRPALAKLDAQRSIALVHPPYEPCFHCWINWKLERHRPLWIRPQTPADLLWAAEQILKHNACAALVCWVDLVRPAALRRLHLLAQQTDTLFMVLRPQAAAQQASAAPLRLVLDPTAQGIEARIIKRQGPSASAPVPITLYPPRPVSVAPVRHVSLDQSLPALALPGRVVSRMAG